MEADDRAYVAGLRMLGRRELSEGQVRQRLEKREFEPEDIDAAVTRLKRERALDDRRTALACARTEVVIKHRGRLRVLRSVEALGIAKTIARAAVAEVFADIDESTMIQKALDRRLRHGASLDDATVARRVYRYLLAQGFNPEQVSAVVRQRKRNG